MDSNRNPLKWSPYSVLNNGRAFIGPSSTNINSQNKMAPAVVGAIISAAAGLASAGVGAWSQHRTNQINQRLQNEAYAQNLLQWQRENAFNSPLAQRRRLDAAGLNAGLIYQNGTGSAVSASSPQATAPDYQNPFSSFGVGLGGSSTNITSSYLDNKLRQEQIRSVQLDNDIKEERRKPELNNLLALGRKINQEYQNLVQNYNIDAARELRDANIHIAEMQKFADAHEYQSMVNKDFEDSADYRAEVRLLELADKRASIAANNASTAASIEQTKASRLARREAMKKVAAIRVADRRLAFQQWCFDVKFPEYLEKHKSDNFFYDNGYKKSTISQPGAWFNSLSASQKRFYLYQFSQEVNLNDPNSPYYQAYYRTLNESDLDEIVRGFYRSTLNSEDTRINLPTNK